MLRPPVNRPRGSKGPSHNHKVIYTLVRRNPQFSRADLVRDTKLTFPSVSRIVDELIQAGLVQEGSTRRGGMGKPPVSLSINPHHAVSLGIHHHSGHVDSLLIDALGNHLQSSTRQQDGQSLREVIHATLDELVPDLSKVIGVGIQAASSSLDEAFLNSVQELRLPLYPGMLATNLVQLERYFGSGQHLERFIYFNATYLKVGAFVRGSTLGQNETLEKLLRVSGSILGPDAWPHQREEILGVLASSVVLIEPQAVIVSGLIPGDFKRFAQELQERLQASVEVIAGVELTGTPVFAAAALPLYETFMPS